MLKIPNPFPSESGVVILNEAQDCNRLKITQQLLSDTYTKPYIIEADGVRSLYFTRAHTQSALRLSAPEALEFSYTRMMMCALLFQPNPQQICLLGMGGGSLAKFCYCKLPASHISVVEIDAYIIAFRDQFLLPQDDARFKIVHADAGEYVAANRNNADIIMLDAFDGSGSAAAEHHVNFYRDLRKNLSANFSSTGVAVCNMIGSKANRFGHLQAIYTAFSGNIITLPVEHDGNYLVFAFSNPHFEPRWRWMQTQSRAMQKRYGLNFPAYVTALMRARKEGFLEKTMHQSED